MISLKSRNRIISFMVAAAIAGTLAGCATTFIPISWGMREKVEQLSKQDVVLDILFRRYDPERKTLRVDGASFNIFVTRHGDWKQAGAYRAEHALIYRNMEARLDDLNLRNVMVHEMAHHIWAKFLSYEQKERWNRYLQKNPSKWQAMVRKYYEDARLHDSEDFAYTVEFPRKADIEELAMLGVITQDEMQRWEQACVLPDRKEGAEPTKLAGQ